MIQHLGIFGCPTQVQTDQGSQFENQLMEELFRVIGVYHLINLAYSKEENAIVERVNKEVMRHLRGIIFKYNEIAQWSFKYLPLVQRIINSTRHGSTGATPAELVFGNAVDLDRGLFLPHAEISNNRRILSEWSADMLGAQKKLTELAVKQQKAKDAAHMANASEERTTFDRGEYVLMEYLSNTPSTRKAPNKFLANLKGPLIVLGNTGNTYHLKDLINHEKVDVHITKLHPYYVGKHGLTPKQVALRDVLTLFEVDGILNHSGDKKSKRKELDFLVSFTGFTDEHNLWIPYSEIRDHELLHHYLIQNKMRNLIPDKFKERYRDL